MARPTPSLWRPSCIIAAASKTAKWVREHGAIRTEMVGREIIGQIQVAKVSDYGRFVEMVKAREVQWIEAANRDVASGLVRRGGGVRRLEVRKIERGDGGHMAVIRVYAILVMPWVRISSIKSVVFKNSRRGRDSGEGDHVYPLQPS